MSVATVQATKSAAFLHRIRDPHRPGQGALARRIAYWTGVGFALWASFDLWKWLQGYPALSRSLFPETLPAIPALGATIGWAMPIAIVVFAALWVGVAWVVADPRLADRLIDTEAEMKKVSWPAFDEAWAATKVVAIAVLVFTALLVVFDFAITTLLGLLFNLEI